MKLTKIYLAYIMLIIPLLYVSVSAEENAYNSTPEIIKTLEAYPDDNSCMEKVNLEPVTDEETDELVTCILAEIVRMGYPLCNEECLKRLSKDELEKFFDMRAKQTRELLDKELTRRIAEQIKRR